MPGGKFTDSLITENLKVATEYFKLTVANKSNKNSGGSIGFIPFKMNFTMDGLSGVKIYNELVLDTSFLPPGYTNTTKFIVTGVDHKLNKNDWETTIHTTLIPTTSNISKVTGSLKFSLQEEVTPVTPDNSNLPPSNNNNNAGDCGKATPSNVDTIYPRSVKWQNGSQPVIYPATVSPTVTVNLSSKPEVARITTLITYQEFIQAADALVNTMIPGASKAIKKRVVTSALAVGISEQGRDNKIRGFNNNVTGVEASGFKVFASSDVNGKVKAKENGTGIKKFYYSFSSLKVGLIPLVSNIINRNMFAQADDPNQWAWRYYRDWNGYGARTLPAYKNGTLTDCQIISAGESKYNTALNAVNRYSIYK